MCPASQAGCIRPAHVVKWHRNPLQRVLLHRGVSRARARAREHCSKVLSVAGFSAFLSLSRLVAMTMCPDDGRRREGSGTPMWVSEAGIALGTPG